MEMKRLRLSMADSMPSVVTQDVITNGTLLGPLPLSPTSVDPLVLLAWRCQDEFPTTRQVIKVSPRDQDNDWLIHVQTARDSEEQNLEVVVKSGHLYYRAIKDIGADEELFVWFGDELSDILHLPVVPSTIVDGEKRYVCILCQQLFQYPNCVISHLLYRCERRSLPPSAVEPRNKKMTRVKGFDIASLTRTEEPRQTKRNTTDSVANSRSEGLSTKENPQNNLPSNIIKISTGDSSNLSAFRKVDRTMNSFNVFPRPPVDIILPTATTNYCVPPYHVPTAPQDGSSLVASLTSAFVPAHVQLGEKIRAKCESRALLPSYNNSRASHLHLPYSKPFPSPLDNFSRKTVPSPLLSFLPPSLAALTLPTQNWCAKCNASFRMTSDLVYHMRSHHKRETTAVKERREEKLKCNICNESFRERHHLTRHMTSHQ